MNRTKEMIIVGIMTVLMIVFCTMLATRDVNAQGLRKVSATAYYDAYGHGRGADGRRLVEGLTIAGRVEDLGKTVVVYDENMRLIGIYEFRDVGYGKATGKGRSQIRKGKSLGDIEAGMAVDIYFKTYKQCKEWGRRQVYIQFLNARG